LWKAGGPRSPEVAQGLFEVGSDAGFVREEVPLRGELPEGFYVSVFEKPTARGTTGVTAGSTSPGWTAPGSGRASS
jgi:hypothetical protein